MVLPIFSSDGWSEKLRDDEPLRLNVAAALAFPDGSMRASGLRREAARGRLVIERIAGKDYTTMGAIKLMREKCRSKVREQGCGSNLNTGGSPQLGSSATDQSNDALAFARRKLQKLNVL
jgi:hypothetical protein